MTENVSILGMLTYTFMMGYVISKKNAQRKSVPSNTINKMCPFLKADTKKNLKKIQNYLKYQRKGFKREK